MRKEKEKTKTGSTEIDVEHSPTIPGEYYASNGRRYANDTPVGQHTDPARIKSGSSGSDHHLPFHGAYQRVQKPHVPVIVDSGIEKSPFRSLMDKKSEGARKALSKTFGKKRRNEEHYRPPTSTTIRPYAQEMDAEYPSTPPPPATMSGTQQTIQSSEYIRLGPPSAKLPAVPQGPQLKCWTGGRRPPQPWNKLRKDPELWDADGDTLVFLFHKDHQGIRPRASFRVSSHVLEDTDSQYLMTLLRDGCIEESSSMPPSPSSSNGMGSAYPVRYGRHQSTPPISEHSSCAYDGQISYEITLAAPLNAKKADTIRHQVTTRNVFAMLYKASLVGANLYEALIGLQERLEVYLPPDADAAGMIIEWLMHKDMDDIRDNPALAASILAWSELQSVRWEEGWKEAYVHSAGMHNRMVSTSDFRFVSPITKALLERGSLEIQVRIQNCEARLHDFDFGDMWPVMTSQPSPARQGFERLGKFFCQFYLDALGIWPPAALKGEEQWLTRSLTQKLQKDFGALYDYLVNREVTWDCSEERSGRKWNINQAGNQSFDADTFDLPFTDLLVAFDNRHRYPHLPHPYPLVPESMPVQNSKENLFKTPKKQPKTDDKMAERRVALAYSESTNLYLLGSDFVNNDMVDAFIRFEKADRTAEVDPFEARRGRWILIYGILQTLASISVDTPDLRYTENVSYHLNPRLRGTPPWKGASQSMEEAEHVNSYCWAIRDTWRTNSPVKIGRPQNPMAHLMAQTPIRYPPSSSTLSYDESETFQGSEAGSSNRNPFTPVRSKSRSTFQDHRLLDTADLTLTSSGYGAGSSNAANSSGYGPGIEMVETDWPIQVETREAAHKDFTKKSRSMSDLAIKDFDDFD